MLLNALSRLSRQKRLSNVSPPAWRFSSSEPARPIDSSGNPTLTPGQKLVVDQFQVVVEDIKKAFDEEAAKRKPKKRYPSFLAILAFWFLLWYTTYCYANDLSFSKMFIHLLRAVRSTKMSIAIALDYKYSFYGIEEGHKDYKKVYHEVNLRTAKRLLALALLNKGTYIKAGQQLASLDHAVPAEFVEVLSVLQDRVEPRSYCDIEKTFQAEFGKSPHELFVDFTEAPIAAASIAQVHRACLFDGREVAVKVQYPELAEMVKSDLLTITFLTKCLAWLFPQMEFTWVLPEFKQAMAQELNFIHEANNSEQLKFNFRNSKCIKVPDVYWDYTTPKILTMEFIHGIKINNVDTLKRNNFDLVKLAELLMKCFSKQIFLDGFIHADPHPGNLLVRRHRGQTQIVILDHGLYTVLPKKMRIRYCKLWKAIVARDLPGIDKYGRKLGCGDRANLFALILTFRPPSNSDVGLGSNLTAKDFDEIRQMFGGKTRMDNVEMLNHLLADVPREVLFVLRCTTHLRTINKALGAKVNRFELMGKAAAKALYLHTKGGWDSIYGWFSLTYFNWRLYLFVIYMEAAKYVKSFLDRFQSTEASTTLLPSIRDDANKENATHQEENRFEKNVVDPQALTQGDAKEIQCGVTKVVFGTRK